MDSQLWYKPIVRVTSDVIGRGQKGVGERAVVQAAALRHVQTIGAFIWMGKRGVGTVRLIGLGVTAFSF